MAASGAMALWRGPRLAVALARVRAAAAPATRHRLRPTYDGCWTARAAAVLAVTDGAAYCRRAPVGRTGRRSPGCARTSRCPSRTGRTGSTALHRTGARATADVELRYRVEGYDKAPVTVGRTLRPHLERDGGQWYVDAERARAEDRPAAVGPGRRCRPYAVRHSLVLGVGQSGGGPALVRGPGRPGRAGRRGRVGPGLGATGRRPRTEVAGGDGGAARVARLLPTGGSRRSPPARWARRRRRPRTGSSSTPRRTACSADFGKQVVLTHETTHVATRADTTAATPLWLSEGYADWVGYRGHGPYGGPGRARTGPRGGRRRGAGRAAAATGTSASAATRAGWRGRTRAAGWPAG